MIVKLMGEGVFLDEALSPSFFYPRFFPDLIRFFIFIFQPFQLRADGGKLPDNVFVAALEVVDAVDGRGALGDEAGED